MPTYSYVCDACGGSFELEQRISENPIDKCQLCGKPKARRQIVSGNFILKGGGWYSDGYGSSKSSSSSSTSSPAKTETKSDSSSTSTPAKTETSTPAKTETKASAAS